MLSEEHKTKRAGSALTFLTWYSKQDDEFLSHIVTGDETWVSYVTPESKQQSMEWRHTSSPKKTQIQADNFNPQDHVLFFGTGKEFCLLNSCLKAQQ
jgi:hypothetical protein